MARLKRVNTPKPRFLGPVDRDVDLSSNRYRGQSKRKNRILRGVAGLFDFANPYPWMSEVEAMVHLELERRQVPFSWRFFDGESVQLQYLMPDFHPEFTLREYKVAILILGGFFGTLPGVLDKNALASVLLEEDGWTVVLGHEQEIRENVVQFIDTNLPMLVTPTILGRKRDNPYGTPDFMAQRRAQLAGQGLLRAKFALEPEKQRAQGGSGTDSGRKRLRRRRGPGTVSRSGSRGAR